MAVDVRDHAADGKTQAAELRQDWEYRLVGRVVADENRVTALERRIFHQLAYRAGFVDSRHFDLEDELAGQDLNRSARRRGADIGDRGAQRVALIRCKPIMQGERIAL